jgi:RNA polymerase sigma-70 factor (ECF subfamily)
MQQAEEDLLILAAQDGSQKAFNLLYRRYHKSLLRYAWKVCDDREIARDAVQEAWLKFAGNIRKLEDPRAFRSWLYRQVRWCAIDLLRVVKRHSENAEIFEEELHADARDSGSEDKGELKLAIKRLPAIEKQMIHLFYLDELKVSEIAVVLDIPVGTVKSRLKRARDLLRQRFDS